MGKMKVLKRARDVFSTEDKRPILSADEAVERAKRTRNAAFSLSCLGQDPAYARSAGVAT